MVSILKATKFVDKVSLIVVAYVIGHISQSGGIVGESPQRLFITDDTLVGFKGHTEIGVKHIPQVPFRISGEAAQGLLINKVRTPCRPVENLLDHRCHIARKCFQPAPVIGFPHRDARVE